MKKLFIPLIFVLITGCAGGGGSSAPTAGIIPGQIEPIEIGSQPADSAPSANILPVDGRVVASDPSGPIVPFAEVQTWASGKPLKIRLNRSGLEVREFPCEFKEVIKTSQGELYFKMHSNVELAKGDSGSPVYDYDNRCVGAHARRWPGSSEFYVRPIEELLNLSSSGQEKESSAPFIFSGVTKRFAQVVAGSAGIAKFQVVPRRNALTRFQQAHIEPLPGNSFSVNLVRGDYVAWSSIGTLSYIRGRQIYAVGHSMSGLDNRNYVLPVSLASFYAIKPVQDGSKIKITDPLGPTIGSFKINANTGVLIDTSQMPQLGKATTVFIDGGSRIETVSEYGYEGGDLDQRMAGFALAGPINNMIGDRKLPKIAYRAVFANSGQEIEYSGRYIDVSADNIYWLTKRDVEAAWQTFGRQLFKDARVEVVVLYEPPPLVDN